MIKSMKLLDDVEVTGIYDDSRKVNKGSAFVAIKGLNSDGHEYISNAIKNGASVVVGEKDIAKDLLSGVKYIKVSDSRKTLAKLASEWYGNPAEKLKIIGVTGTDGKTTTSNILYWILKSANKKVGLISTVSAKIGEEEYDTGFHVTNPEPMALHEFLSKMVEKGCEYVVLEVTSHGLDQQRVYGIKFDVSVLTNITHEHIDYHKTFENYAKAKATLFNNSKLAIINSESRDNIEKFIEPQVNKIYYDDKTLNGIVLDSVRTKFKEKYNLLNCAAATLVARKFDISDEDISDGIKNFPGVIGRMQEIKNEKGIRIIVDFAHTPNALENVLNALNNDKPKKSKLISVFGCAGERDVKKRRMMAEISAKNADISIFTAEDPRSENVNEIIAEMVKGSDNIKGAKVYEIPERGEAIYYAINKFAKSGDIVAICGKGHEKSMGYDGVEYPWSDEEAVNEALLGKVKVINRNNKNEKIAVFGLGIEGKDLIRFLKSKGTKPVILEEDENAIVDKEFSDLEIITGSKVSGSLVRFNKIYRSPGVYRYRSDIVNAEKHGVKISSGIKLFFDLCPAKIIGVTGTKGKGTTSTLIYEILKEDGKDVYLAGNIGKPYLEILPKLNKDSVVVLELSSFQLIDLDKSPNVSIVLNITSDHLNWHKDIEEYRKSKENIVSHQNKTDFAVINYDYESSKKFSKVAGGEIFYFSRQDIVKGSYIDKSGNVILSTKETINLGNTDKLLLMGEHNWENVMAAVCAADLLGVDVNSIRKVVFEFKGLEHRLELVREVNDITFYNDSFSTNPEPTIAAIRSFNKPLTLILGGYDKGLDYTEMGGEISENKNVENIILIGDTAQKIKESIQKSGFKGKIVEMGKPIMSEIVDKSMIITSKGGAVILSPASASFDMFRDYKERGKLFKESVSSLPND